MKHLICIGIFGWNAPERRTQRYGAFFVDSVNFAQTVKFKTCNQKLDIVDELLSKRVKLTARVLEPRDSDHIGDMFLDIKPSTPEVNQEFNLGVGVLNSSFDTEDNFIYELHPGDDRKQFWLDPRVLYQLHDQTVEVYAELTDEDFSPVPDIKPSEPGVKALGDGSIVTSGIDPNSIASIKPRITKLEGGMFMLSTDFKASENLEVNYK